MIDAEYQLIPPIQANSARARVFSALHGENQNKEKVICENLSLNDLFSIISIKEYSNSVEKYWRGDMFSKSSGLFTPPLEENGSETKGQLISKGSNSNTLYLFNIYPF